MYYQTVAMVPSSWCMNYYENLADRFYLSVLDVYSCIHRYAIFHFAHLSFGMSFVPRLPKLSGCSSHPSFSFRLVFHCLVPSMLSDHIVNRQSLPPPKSPFPPTLECASRITDQCCCCSLYLLVVSCYYRYR